MAWIERRGVTWYVVWRDGGRRTPKRKLKVGPKKSEALMVQTVMARRALQARLGAGLLVPPRITTAAFVSQWHASRVRRPKTMMLERMLLRVHVLPALGERPLTALRGEVLTAFLADLGRRRSPHIARRTWIMLRRLLADAKRWGYLWENPAGDVETPRAPRHETRALDVDELARLLNAAGSWRPFVVTAALTGLRWGELTALEWGDVDLDGGTLQVRRQRPAGLERLEEPKSFASRRAVDLLTPVRVALTSVHRQCHDMTHTVIPVFHGRRGWYLNHRWFLRAAWRPMTSAAGLPGLRFHDLRHTYASLLLAWDEHPLYVAQQLGHARPSITLDTYAHLLRRRRRIDKSATLARLAGEGGIAEAAK